MAVPGCPQTSVDMGCGQNIESAGGVSANKHATEEREEFWLPPECCRRCNEMLHSDMCNDATPDYDNPRGRNPESLATTARRGAGIRRGPHFLLILRFGPKIATSTFGRRMNALWSATT
jgi:hypothetical protein